MQISQHKVVTLEYSLTDDKGTLIDEAKGGESFAFIHGVGGIIPGLESALEGKAAGDSVSVTIKPEEGYGDRDEALVMAVPRTQFEGADDIVVGMQFHTPTEDGGVRVVTVVNVDDENVTVDANHPLAGVILNFDVNVLDVRDATQEELDHGHVHGPGGHEH
jgi:FKBP-type peptidyl-prolyl cis-trans isomerase SlyD